MDQKFTEMVIAAMGPKTTPKMRRILGSLIQHIHDFTRENQVTVEEWMAGVQFINRIGQMSDDKRNEGILVSDVFGLETLVDAITYQLEEHDHTSTAIIGPFYVPGSPKYPYGHSIIQKDEGGQKSWVFGRVTDTDGNPLEGAQLEVWHTSPKGLYDVQDPEQPPFNLRGTFTTNANGEYAYVALRPTNYPIPYDGPAGDLLQLMDRHPFRPSHIHWRVTKPGFRTLITQIYDSDCEYVKNDSVFAVKDELVVHFVEAPQDIKDKYKVEFSLEYNIALPTEKQAHDQVAKRLAAQKAEEDRLHAAASVSNGKGTNGHAN